ncbi:MAG: FAD-dependent oxidoreductase, partial [Acidimicrobiia bacterium]|nr:FAD-dependent oxidoreductase [Acidimicrobiia bacterium]
METAGEDLSPRPSLDGRVEVDVAVLGAGYTGLWTAYELQRRDPGVRIAVCEAEVAGFGASGRNGSWAVAGLGISLGELSRRHGDDAARRTTRALRSTLDEMASVCAAEGIDAGMHRGGALRLARGRHELAAVRAASEL